MRRKIIELLKKSGIVTTGIIIVNIIVWLVNIFAGGGSFFGLFISGGGYVKDFGELTYQTVLIKSEWWRLITCGYLHNGVFHLVFNIWALLSVGRKKEYRIGALKFFAVYHIGLVITAFLWCLIFRESSMIGASLGIFVIFGMYLAFKKQDKGWNEYWLSEPEKKYFLSYAIVSCILGIPTIIVHGIALCVGLVLGIVLTKRQSKENTDE